MHRIAIKTVGFVTRFAKVPDLRRSVRRADSLL
jgi:hypothetical protein